MDLNYLKTSADLIILPLVAYNIMLGMDWLEKQHVILDCLNKNLTCIDDQGNYNVVYGVDKKISIRQISMLQAKKTVRKGCKIYVVNIQIYNVENKQEIENISIINEFKDVFPEELLRLIPK